VSPIRKEYSAAITPADQRDLDPLIDLHRRYAAMREPNDEWLQRVRPMAEPTGVDLDGGFGVSRFARTVSAVYRSGDRSASNRPPSP
jgi:hypothetical protein